MKYCKQFEKIIETKGTHVSSTIVQSLRSEREQSNIKQHVSRLSQLIKHKAEKGARENSSRRCKLNVSPAINSQTTGFI